MAGKPSPLSLKSQPLATHYSWWAIYSAVLMGAKTDLSKLGRVC